MKPNYRLENGLFRNGYQSIAGLDEAGRGAWAGPVVAAAVVIDKNNKITGLKDSKLLTSKKREYVFSMIYKQALSVGVGMASEKIVDSYGILEATRRAFLKAIRHLDGAVDHLLVDGIHLFKHDLPVRFIVGGDRKVASIAAASIIAKVTRDKILEDYHKIYPAYGFHQHKGYGTKQHRKNIYQNGVCEIHRKSYKPLIDFNI